MRPLPLLLLVAACGGGSNGNVPLDQLGQKLAATTCTKIFQCCNAAEIMQQFKDVNPPITTEAQCEQYYGGLLSALVVPDYQASVAAGRITYDGDAAGACLDAIGSLSCSQYTATSNSALPTSVTACMQLTTPRVASGGACTQGYECTTNNCVGATVMPGGMNQDGMCEDLPAAGQPCDFNCQTGLYCGVPQGGSSEVCIAQHADGASCQADDECTSGTCTGASGSGGGTCGAAQPVCTGG